MAFYRSPSFFTIAPANKLQKENAAYKEAKLHKPRSLLTDDSKLCRRKNKTNRYLKSIKRSKQQKEGKSQVSDRNN